jgi:hypothetical protein
MNITNFQVLAYDGKPRNTSVNRFPDECPHCHKGVQVKVFQGFLSESGVQIVFRCPRENCNEIFIGYYKQHTSGAKTVFRYEKSSFGTIQERKFSEDISEISKDFVDIYNQALSAESHSLNEVVGIALRKALEYLIKDYLIKKKEIEEEKVKKKFLGKCIKEFIDNPNIKDMAERAVWLGNDETHYVRKWENKDISDLKLLIDVTLHWIEMENLTEKYKKEMI